MTRANLKLEFVTVLMTTGQTLHSPVQTLSTNRRLLNAHHQSCVTRQGPLRSKGESATIRTNSSEMREGCLLGSLTPSPSSAPMGCGCHSDRERDCKMENHEERAWPPEMPEQDLLVAPGCFLFPFASLPDEVGGVSY